MNGTLLASAFCVRPLQVSWGILQTRSTVIYFCPVRLNNMILRSEEGLRSLWAGKGGVWLWMWFTLLDISVLFFVNLISFFHHWFLSPSPLGRKGNIILMMITMKNWIHPDCQRYLMLQYFLSVVSIFFAVLVFGVMCWSRDWLLNPNFNYLSWSYAFAVVAGGIHAFSGFTLLHVSSPGVICLAVSEWMLKRNANHIYTCVVLPGDICLTEPRL